MLNFQGAGCYQRFFSAGDTADHAAPSATIGRSMSSIRAMIVEIAGLDVSSHFHTARVRSGRANIALTISASRAKPDIRALMSRA